MKNMFYGASNFNGDISSWRTGSVTTMKNMFREATSFNSDISGWETDSVTNIQGMLESATSFDQDLTGWDLSSIDDVESMFKKPPSSPLPISTWRFWTSSNDDMRLAVMKTFSSRFDGFFPTGFAGWEAAESDPSTWDTSLVTDMSV